LEGSLALFVNDQKVRDINFSLYRAYQYFPHSEPENIPGEWPCMPFDEVHFLLAAALQRGDVLRIENTAGDYDVDLIELEEVDNPLLQAVGYLEIIDAQRHAIQMGSNSSVTVEVRPLLMSLPSMEILMREQL
jgi:hypothetical protein